MSLKEFGLQRNKTSVSSSSLLPTPKSPSKQQQQQQQQLQKSSDYNEKKKSSKEKSTFDVNNSANSNTVDSINTKNLFFPPPPSFPSFLDSNSNMDSKDSNDSSKDNGNSPIYFSVHKIKNTPAHREIASFYSPNMNDEGMLPGRSSEGGEKFDSDRERMGIGMRSSDAGNFMIGNANSDANANKKGNTYSDNNINSHVNMSALGMGLLVNPFTSESNFVDHGDYGGYGYNNYNGVDSNTNVDVNDDGNSRYKNIVRNGSNSSHNFHHENNNGNSSKMDNSFLRNDSQKTVSASSVANANANINGSNTVNAKGKNNASDKSSAAVSAWNSHDDRVHKNTSFEIEHADNSYSKNYDTSYNSDINRFNDNKYNNSLNSVNIAPSATNNQSKRSSILAIPIMSMQRRRYLSEEESDADGGGDDNDDDSDDNDDDSDDNAGGNEVERYGYGGLV